MLTRCCGKRSTYLFARSVDFNGFILNDGCMHFNNWLLFHFVKFLCRFNVQFWSTDLVYAPDLKIGEGIYYFFLVHPFTRHNTQAGY